MLVSGFSLITAVPAQAVVNIFQAGGGGAISADTANNSASGNWTPLTNIQIAEQATSDIAANQTGVTLVLVAPAGFQFYTGVAPSVTGAGGDITAIGLSISASNITVTFTTDNFTDQTDTITIGADPVIKVQPLLGNPLATGNITMYVATSNSTIAGITEATNFGTLTEVAGAVHSLSITQEPTDTLVNVAISPPVTVKAEDQFHNPVPSQNISVVLIGSGNLTGTSPKLTDPGGVATFNDLKIDVPGPNKQLRFTHAGGNVSSIQFNITIAGIIVNPTAGLVTSESGGTANFTIVLTSQPGNNVTIGLISSDLTEGTLSVDNVTFTAGNWYDPQDITVTGVDDIEPDGDIPYTIITAPAVSADEKYNNMNASDISVTNMDNEPQIGPPVEGVTDVSNMVTSTGLFTQDVTTSSGDNNVQLTVDQGTTGLTATGQPLSQLIIFPLSFPPDPPENASTIGLAYDFRPDGATFDQPVTITFTYNPNSIPPGVNEEYLSIAFYDDINGEWVVLDNIVVDPLTHTITGQTTHFTPFTVIAFTEPASFTISDLILSPSEIYIGETTTISITITNTGDLAGSYSVSLKIDGVVIETKQVTLNEHDSQTVDFSVSLNTAGTYNISIGTLSGVLTVIEPTSTAAPTQTQEPAPPTTQTPAPSTTQEPAPTSTPAPNTTPSQTVAPTPASAAAESGTNWGMIGGIIGGVIVIAVFLGFWITHRRD